MVFVTDRCKVCGILSDMLLIDIRDDGMTLGCVRCNGIYDKKRQLGYGNRMVVENEQ